MTLQELEIISILNDILKDKSVAKVIEDNFSNAKEKLVNSSLSFITEIMPLSVFGNKLPKEINLCRLFILKANTKSKIEKHTNSYQRTFTYYGEGDTKILNDGVWRSNIKSDKGDLISDRWLSVPENTWHEPIALSNDWGTITFHTASENEIMDEYKNFR